MKKFGRLIEILTLILYERIPLKYGDFWRHKIKNLYQNQCVEREVDSDVRAKQFIITQIKISMAGICISLILGILLLGISFCREKTDILIKRNPFGSGSRQVILNIKNEEGSTSIPLEIKEQSISKKKLESLYEEFFIKLGEYMKGKNSSLQQVNQPLKLDDKIQGFPFQIAYEIQDLNYIRYDGALGRESLQLKHGKLETKITVKGTYQGKSKEKIYLITIIPAQKKRKNLFEKVNVYMKQQEKDSRTEPYVAISSSVGGSIITESGEKEKMITIWLGSLVATIGILVHQYSSLKESAKATQEEMKKDFPIIVHLISLYMGAGLSFARAIQRISGDYRKGFLIENEHYAFEQLVQMDVRMQMGISQKEACEIWANNIGQEEYQKLAMLLMQGMLKGSRELKSFLHQIEKEAFRSRVDTVRKRGEEASTKMLLPMAVLMLLVMVIVMFPAMMQFQSF